VARIGRHGMGHLCQNDVVLLRNVSSMARGLNFNQMRPQFLTGLRRGF
jgi:hypothetical protein